MDVASPVASVVVPAYNSARTIGMCLEALSRQDLKGPIELIVVDDGSTDTTGEIARGFEGVRYVRQENRGPAAARNRGAQDASAAVILFTDSDCVPEPDWAAQMLRPFADPAVAAVKGAYRTLQTGVVARFSQLEFEERFELLKKAGSVDMIDTYSAGFRASVFREMGGFNTSFPVANNEDTELSYRMARKRLTMLFNPEAVVAHLNHPDSVRRYARLKFWRGYWRMAVYRCFPEKMMSDTYTPKALKLQSLLLVALIVTAPAAILTRVGLAIFAFEAAALAALMLPFMLFSLRRDPLIAPFAPFLLALRAGSIGLGALWGTLRPARIAAAAGAGRS